MEIVHHQGFRTDGICSLQTKYKKEKKMKGLLKYPKEIKIFWLVDFILGFEFIGSILLVFFKDWGGLTQTETQTLQSWFTLCIFLLEIPTGVYGDVQGKKKSVILGYVFLAISPIVYSLAPNIWLFLLGEFIFAIGIAFVSGAEQGWMYDTAERLGLKEEYDHIQVVSQNFHLFGMILASSLTGVVLQILPVQHVFKIGALTAGIAILLLTTIPDTDHISRRSLKPKYKETIVCAWNMIKRNTKLQKLVAYIALLSCTSYFVIWLYQEALKILSVPETSFGIYRIVLLLSEIGLSFLAIKLLRQCNIKYAMSLIAVLIAIGFLIAGTVQSTISILILLLFSGGIGLSLQSILSKDLNEEIDKEQRATVLSMGGMVKRLAITVFNPFVGLLVDSKGVFFAFTCLGVLSLISLFVIPKGKRF
ncbi:MAG: MFS transporter [Candidatus Dojkabacteria bacterium]